MAAWLLLAVLAGLLLAGATHRLLHGRAPGLRLAATAGVPALVAVLIAVALQLGAPPPLPQPSTAPPPPPPAQQPAAAADKGAAAIVNALTPTTGTVTRGIHPATPPDFDPAAFVRAQLAALAPGEIVFNPPDTMREGRSERITVRIARADAEARIKSGLEGRGVAQAEAIEVGTFMRVRLYGDGFQVTPRSDENQAVPETGFAEWIFDVLPEAGGSMMLTLAVAVRFKLPGSDEVTDLPVLTRDITVQVDAWWRAKQLFAANWQWFLGGIGSVLVALAGYFGRRWLERA